MPDDVDLPEPPPPSPPVAAALVADQAGAHATRVHGHHGPFHTHCENCGTKLEGPWCHRCGQHDFEFHRSFRHVFWEALESFFHFEGKFFQNIVVLLFQPGRLTTDFNAGKRAAQMPPFRLYVFVSLLFFFLLYVGTNIRPNLRFGPGSGASLTRDGETILGQRTEPAPTSVAPPVPADAPPAVQQIMRAVGRDLEREQNPHRAIERLREAADQVAQSVNTADATATRDGTRARPTPVPETSFEAEMAERARRAMTPEGQAQMVQAFLTALPKILLFCVPFFALFTRVLFRGAGQVYLQHLVLALHFHTFIYLFVLFRDGWAFLGGLTGLGLRPWIVLAANLWLVVYPLLMLRRLFGNPWPATFLKTFVLLVAYGFTLLGGFLSTALILFLLL